MNNPLSGFSWGKRTYIMGIINVTPDSFSGDGLLAQKDGVNNALEQARQFIAEGADILDVGGESTRPGAEPVSEEKELSRVLPVIQALAKASLEIPISLDTYKASVAEAGLSSGASWLNDIWGLKADPKIAAVASHYQVPLILMHNRSQPGNAKLVEQLSAYPTGNRIYGPCE